MGCGDICRHSADARIHLGTYDSTIHDRLSESVHFFSLAFLAFSSKNERTVHYRETKNGLYTTLPFLLSNTLVNIPLLFICTLLFTLISYWVITYVNVCIQGARCSSASSNSSTSRFVARCWVALAIGDFVNGFWMSVGG
ncbi:hypothetical protein B0H10DRAFT_2218797 [Mycena sp. CBHHK59/15]|nr:hypothetical protein B0H10DRAFT_2218797 [Mycena sp. CBHHK59/15]